MCMMVFFISVGLFFPHPLADLTVTSPLSWTKSNHYWSHQPCARKIQLWELSWERFFFWSLIRLPTNRAKNFSTWPKRSLKSHSKSTTGWLNFPLAHLKLVKDGVRWIPDSSSYSTGLQSKRKGKGEREMEVKLWQKRKKIANAPAGKSNPGPQQTRLMLYHWATETSDITS